MKEYGDLESLFKAWMKKQKEDGEKNTGIFVSDGYIYKEKYEANTKKKILFILKESHYFSGDKVPQGEKEVIEAPQVDFYKDFFDEEYTNKDNEGNPICKNGEPLYCLDKNNTILPKAFANKAKKYKYFDNPSKQKEKIARMSEYILEGKITSSYGSLKQALAQVAFMNINKKGGSDTTNSKSLSEYYQKYSTEIINEIKILQPKIIVLMINNEEIEKDLQDKLKEIKFVKMIHTAARGKNLNLTTPENDYYKKIFKDHYEEGNGPFLKFCPTTERFLARFIYSYDKGVLLKKGE